MSAEPRIAARGSGPYAWYALALLTFINAVNFIDRNIIFALFEPIKDELGLSDTQLGWLGSAYIIVFSVAAIPLGLLSDLKSRRAVIASGVTLWAVFTGLAGLARQYWQLLLCRSMVGVGEAAYSPAAQSLLADYFPQRGRALALGIFWSGLALGGVAGIWLGGELAHLYGWRAAFLVVGLPGLLLAILASRLKDPARPIRPFSFGEAVRRFELNIWRLVVALWPLWVMGVLGLAAAYFLDRSGRVGPDVEGAVLGAAVTAGVLAIAARGVRAIFAHRRDRIRPAALTTVDEFLEAAQVVLKTPTLIWVFLGGALISFAMNGLVGWSPSYMQRELGLPPQVAGRTIGIWGLAAGLLGVVFGGKLGDKLAERWKSGRVIAGCAGFLLGGPLCIWLLSVRDLEWFIPLFFVTLFLFTWYHGPVSATVFDVVPARVGASVMGAYVFFTHMAGDAIAYPLIGAFSDHFGIRTAMLVLPTVGMVGGLVFLMGARTVARDLERVRRRVS